MEYIIDYFRQPDGALITKLVGLFRIIYTVQRCLLSHFVKELKYSGQGYIKVVSAE